MAKRGRPRKPTGGVPPPPDRKTFEQQRAADIAPNGEQRLLGQNGRPGSVSELFVDTSLGLGKSSVSDDRHDGETLVVPMRCAKDGSRFAIEFEKGSGHQTWTVSRTYLLGRATAVEPSKAQPIDLMKMFWCGAICPVCSARCGPIFCGSDHYTCDGGVSVLPGGQRLHKCACGESGILSPSLQQISAGRAGSPREAGSGNVLSPAGPLRIGFRRE
jgi:hypothetical protein